MTTTPGGITMAENILHDKCEFPCGTGHIPRLDGLRGLAVLLILLYHGFSLPCGWSGVDLFFVLSGFFITGILIDTKGAPHYFRSFYLRRILRIFPLYFLFLGLIFIVFPILTGNGQVFHAQLLSYFVFVQNWTMPLHWTGQVGNEGYVVPLWSIAIEEQFYFVWPILIKATKPKRLVYGMVIMILVGVIVSTWHYLHTSHWGTAYMSTVVRMGAICIGGLIAVAIRQIGLIQSWRLHFSAIAWFTGIILLYFAFMEMPVYPENWFFRTLGFLLFPVFWGAILLRVLMKSPDRTAGIILEWKPLIYLGKRSFAIYLIHFPLLVYWRMNLMPSMRIDFLDSYALDAIGSLLCIAFTLLLSEISWRLVERPILRWKDLIA